MTLSRYTFVLADFFNNSCIYRLQLFPQKPW